jgi:hypothetical protein
MKPHLGKDTLIETPDEARARVFRMDKIERRLAYLAQADKFEERILLSLDEAIKILEMEERARAEMRRAG